MLYESFKTPSDKIISFLDNHKAIVLSSLFFDTSLILTEPLESLIANSFLLVTLFVMADCFCLFYYNVNISIILTQTTKR